MKSKSAEMTSKIENIPAYPNALSAFEGPPVSDPGSSRTMPVSSLIMHLDGTESIDEIADYYETALPGWTRRFSVDANRTFFVSPSGLEMITMFSQNEENFNVRVLIAASFGPRK